MGKEGKIEVVHHNPEHANITGEDTGIIGLHLIKCWLKAGTKNLAQQVNDHAMEIVAEDWGVMSLIQAKEKDEVVMGDNDSTMQGDIY